MLSTLLAKNSVHKWRDHSYDDVHEPESHQNIQIYCDFKHGCHRKIKNMNHCPNRKHHYILTFNEKYYSQHTHISKTHSMHCWPVIIPHRQSRAVYISVDLSHYCSAEVHLQTENAARALFTLTNQWRRNSSS